MAVEIITGEDATFTVQLKNSAGSSFDMSTASEVLAVLHDEKNAISAEVACADSGGADWSTSLVEVVFSDTETAAFTGTGGAYVEIQTTVSGTKTRYRTSGVIVKQGFID